MKAILLLTLFTATRLLGDDFAVPVRLGNSDTPFPFGENDGRYQQVYGAGAFSSLTPVGGWITAIGFALTGGELFDFTGNAQISFSTTSRAVDGLSTVFAENVGIDDQIVVGRDEVINFIHVPDGPAGVGSLITLTTPFFYNPAAGNLLMDVRMYRGLGSSDPQNPFQLLASNLPTDTTSRIYAFERDSFSGNPSTVALVTGFRITPVPEPSTTVLTLTALFTALIFGFRQKHKPTTRKE